MYPRLLWSVTQMKLAPCRISWWHSIVSTRASNSKAFAASKVCCLLKLHSNSLDSAQASASTPKGMCTLYMSSARYLTDPIKPLHHVQSIQNFQFGMQSTSFGSMQILSLVTMPPKILIKRWEAVEYTEPSYLVGGIGLELSPYGVS